MPDGQVVAFPDEMPKEQINAMLRLRYPETDTGRVARKTAIAERIYGDMQSGKTDAPMTGQQKWADAVHSVGSGLNTFVGAGIGLPGTLMDAAEYGAQGVDRRFKGMNPKEYEAYRTNLPDPYGTGNTILPQRVLPNIEETLGGMESIAPGSTSYEPKTRLTRMAKNTTSFGPAVLPGLGYAIGTEAAPDSIAIPLAASVIAPTALKKVAARAVTPFATDAERIAQAKTLKNAGVRVSAGQKTGSKFLRFLESEAGTSFNTKQNEDLTRYAAKLVGEDADRLTPNVLDNIDKRIGGQFEYLGKMTTITPDRQLGSDLGNVLRKYDSVTSSALHKPVVRQFVGDIMAAGKGSVPGQTYQKIRSDALKLARETADPDVRRALQGIAHAVDDVMERSIASTTPHLLGEYKRVRRQYKNLQPLEDALSRAGEEAKMGLVTPATFEAAVKKGAGKKGWNRATGDATEVARAAGALMKPLANSNTAGRWAARAAVGGGIGYGSGDNPWDQFSMGALGALAPAVVARLLLSRPGRKLVGNQLLSKQIRSPTMLTKIAGPLLGKHP